MKNIILTLILFVFIGCVTHPRYRTGGYETKPPVTNLDDSPTTSENVKFGMILEDYLGKPYKGKSKYEEGLDCSHFTQTVFMRYNRTELPRTAEDQYTVGTKVHFNNIRYGDLVFFRTTRKGISHVGIYVGNRRFIHASTSHGVIISGLDEKYWSERYVGARRVLK